MKRFLNEKLIRLAHSLASPLYIVGGFTRDFLAGFSKKKDDIDLCGPISAEEFVKKAEAVGFKTRAVYQNTGTVKLDGDNGEDYEFSTFRTDKYVRGKHTPSEIFFTEDITLDARRRDFTANAVYYDIKNERFVDPLGGIRAIQERRLTTVDRPEKVFGEDGLRLMRLARQCAQLGFTADKETEQGARVNSGLILDIVPERIFTELLLVLHADEKYGVDNAPYRGLCCLERTGVLEKILPELSLGKGMAQRADFHHYDVLEHSFRAANYAPKSVRLAALLHDVGKPFCQIRDGHVHAHPEEGERIAKEILQRLKAPKKMETQVCALVKWHMYDFDCRAKENKLRKFFVAYLPLLDDLLLVKQADFSACTDDMATAPTVKKWRELLAKIKAENAPLTLRELAVNGNDLLEVNIEPRLISKVLKELLNLAVCNPELNTKEKLFVHLPAAVHTAKTAKK